MSATPEDDTEVVVSCAVSTSAEDGAGDVISRAFLIAADDELEDEGFWVVSIAVDTDGIGRISSPSELSSQTSPPFPIASAVLMYM